MWLRSLLGFFKRKEETTLVVNAPPKFKSLVSNWVGWDGLKCYRMTGSLEQTVEDAIADYRHRYPEAPVTPVTIRRHLGHLLQTQTPIPNTKRIAAILKRNNEY